MELFSFLSGLHLVDYVNGLVYVISGLVIVATAVAKVTPSKSDDEKVQKVVDLLHKALAYLPTFGINPNTQKLLDWYEENKPKVEEKPEEKK